MILSINFITASWFSELFTTVSAFLEREILESSESLGFNRTVIGQ